MTLTSPISVPAPTAFERDSRAAIASVRAALSAVLAALPRPVHRPTELARLLGLDKSLAWKIFRCIEDDDPFSAARHFPGEAGFERFVRAAARAGVAASLHKQVERAVAEYHGLIARHGGDRRTFGRMIEGLCITDQGRDLAEEHQRKAAFEANSFIYGIKTRAQLALRMVHPSQQDGFVDVAALAGFVDLVRIRPDASWVIARSAYATSDGAIHNIPGREPIDELDAQQAGAPLLRPFCTTPLPDLQRRVSADGFHETYLPPGPVGETAAVTLVTGEVLRSVAPRFSDQPNETADFVTHLRTPAEWFVDVTLVARGLFDDAPPEFGVYSEVARTIRSRADCHAQDRLCRKASLGNLSGTGRSPEVWSRHVPFLGQLVEHLAQRLGWSLEEFECWQAQVGFPVMSSASIASFPLRCRA